MGHRHFHNSFNMFRTDQGHDRNHLSAEHSNIPMGMAVAPENGSSSYPVDSMLMTGVPCDSQWSLERRTNEFSSSSFSMEVPHFPQNFSGSPCDPFSNSSAARNFYLAPDNNGGHMHSNYYNRQSIHEIENGLLDPTISARRGQFKRKSPGASGACERDSTSRFYGAGSSSGSSEMLEKPTSGYRNIPLGPIGLPHYGGSSLSIAGEGSLRNVRSRSRLDFEPNTMRPHLSSYPSHHYQSTTHPTNHSGMVDLARLNANATTQEQICIPLSTAAHGRIPTSVSNCPSHETNQFLVGGSASEIGGYHHGSISSRHPISHSQYVHGPPAQTAREGRNNYSRRAMPSYRAGPSYSHVGHEAASSDNDLHSISETLSSRYSRPLSAGGWRNSSRNGRSRMAIERFQSISSIADAHNTMGSEALMMVDRSSLYGGSRNLFDQHRDMRLDIDSLGYEELLALGERIGNVSTGLSDDMISKCLIETVYSSSDQNHEEGTCAICLEEYKEKEEVGTMRNCGHDYHVGCIRKWLLMKKICPICKAAALADCSNQE